MLMRRRRATYSTSSVRRSWKSPLHPAVSSVASSSSFDGASASSAGAAFVVVAVVATSKDEEEKDDITFSFSSFLERQTT